jgi:hypothetical protein
MAGNPDLRAGAARHVVADSRRRRILRSLPGHHTRPGPGNTPSSSANTAGAAAETAATPPYPAEKEGENLTSLIKQRRPGHRLRAPADRLTNTAASLAVERISRLTRFSGQIHQRMPNGLSWTPDPMDHETPAAAPNGGSRAACRCVAAIRDGIRGSRRLWLRLRRARTVGSSWPAPARCWPTPGTRPGRAGLGRRQRGRRPAGIRCRGAHRRRCPGQEVSAGAAWLPQGRPGEDSATSDQGSQGPHRPCIDRLRSPADTGKAVPRAAKAGWRFLSMRSR